ncbi:MAG TPA: RagB/SusD family nutrient uptake outer membrane protein [Chitinophagaceae bacterium]|nr:RagB/SusD family nutrient uptake outer membrane protein [Chitinophagaceae bacterium]
MKNNKQLLIVLTALVAGCLSSCSKYLDKKPDNLLTEDQIWQTRANSEAYLNNIYGYVHNSDGGDYASMGAADESSVCIPGTYVRQMVGGNWSSASWYFYNWGEYYAGIRQSFVFEENIDKVPAAEMSEELKLQHKSEAIFLRGWFYWQLLRQYGPFVKLTSVLSRNDDFNQYPRSPFDSCVAYINSLMDKAAQNLPPVWPSTSNYGRPTIAACLAVKAQTTLLAASPQWNGNSLYANFKNHDGTSLAATTYDADKWKTAAAAAKAVIDLGANKLYYNKVGSDFDPYLSYRDLFLTTWNEEIIFANNNWSQWGWTKCVSPGPGGYNMYNATQNIVDAFYMNNGRTIDDPGSGYTETGFTSANAAVAWGHKKGEWNMYANREPRFYVNIQYNARPVLPAPSADDKNYFSSDANKDGTGRVELYYNGKSGQKSAGTNNITGYDVLKRVNPSDNIRLDGSSYRPYILIRYAEILLDYVEALNEYDPAHPDIVTYLNMIRTRAGIPGIEAVYPNAVGNKELMRKYILRERQVELCFENDRYHTLVRRLMLGNPENQTIYGMNVNGDDGGLGFSYTGFYTRTLFQKRFWDNKMYLFPIQQQDIERDNAIVQNPGW